jgi:hypothetical protein
MVSGILATVASGEYLESWIHLLLDFGEAAFGLVAGFVVAAGLFTSRSAERRGVNTALLLPLGTTTLSSEGTAR